MIFKMQPICDDVCTANLQNGSKHRESDNTDRFGLQKKKSKLSLFACWAITVRFELIGAKQIADFGANEPNPSEHDERRSKKAKKAAKKKSSENDESERRERPNQMNRMNIKNIMKRIRSVNNGKRALSVADVRKLDSNDAEMTKTTEKR